MAETSTDAERSPMADVLAQPAFRRFWVAMFLAALVNGNLRFAFVWLALDLSDWEPVSGLIGLAIGVPALLISLPAGAWSDRVERRALVIRLALVGAVGLTLTAVTVWVDVASVALTAALAVVVGAALAGSAPAVQAMVPSLVAPSRLQQGVALQAMGMNVALIAGAIVAGGAITLLGIGGGFATLGVLAVVSAVVMATVEFPPQQLTSRESRVRADVVDGLRFVWRKEPLRSLVGVALIAGFAGGVVQLLLPDIAQEQLGRDAFDTGLLFGALGVGMFCTALIVASRPAFTRRGLVVMAALSLVAGTGMVVIGLSTAYGLTVLAMFGWGLGGGLVLTIQRGLLQEQTPDEYMGRVMGANTLALAGALPVSAVAVGVTTAFVDSGDALWILGLVVGVGSWAVTWRRPIRTA